MKPLLAHFIPTPGRWLPITLGLFLLTACFRFPESPPRVQQVALADLDGDGHLDAFIANGRYGEPYSYPDEIQFELLYNDGAGEFARRGPPTRKMNAHTVALGDFNGDGAVDALRGGIGEVMINDGRGNLGPPLLLPQVDDLGAFRGNAELADLDSDGSLDIFIAFCCGGVAMRSNTDRRMLHSPNLVWLNDGAGAFHITGQRLGTWGSNDVALGDVDGDGTMDAFVANGQTNMTLEGDAAFEIPNRAWLNDGTGRFTDSGQLLGNVDSRAVALGDINGDRSLDALVGNDGPDELWLNDGSGLFTDSGQRLGDDLTRAVFLADLDGDGDLDCFAAGEEIGRSWLNDGRGQFTQSDEPITYDKDEAVTLGDLDDDGSLDILVVGIDAYQVWWNDGQGRYRAHPRS